MTKIIHPLLALIASATDRQLAKYVQALKEENKIFRSRMKGQVHTKPEERDRLLKFGKAIGRAVEELITIVSPQTYNRRMREQQNKKPTPNPKGRTGRRNRPSSCMIWIRSPPRSSSTHSAMPM
ncbi:hypothetical protein OAK47_01875 [Planctomycetaceae bacterium]|nr:hypothetical protein [Planctomycetaceae bacterium]